MPVSGVSAGSAHPPDHIRAGDGRPVKAHNTLKPPTSAGNAPAPRRPTPLIPARDGIRTSAGRTVNI
eukprot:1415171-Prymnesium_polylepis.1